MRDEKQHVALCALSAEHAAGFVNVRSTGN